MTASAGRLPKNLPFVAGEPQHEALARIEYLQTRGGGWCEVSGAAGIGKSCLLQELSRLAQQQGDPRAWLDLSPLTSFDWFGLLADAWRIELTAGISTLEARRRFEDHFAGLAAMNRTAWMFVDPADGFTEDLTRGCRWLTQAARRVELRLLLIVGRRTDDDAEARNEDADLNVELWPWSMPDCERYVAARCRALARSVTFSTGAIAAVQERTAGLPRDVARLLEWSLAAAEAESLVDIDPELIHAIAEEFSLRDRYHPPYEMSAAYGAW